MKNKIADVLKEIRDELRRVNSGWEPPFDQEYLMQQWKRSYTYRETERMSQMRKKK